MAHARRVAKEVLSDDVMRAANGLDAFAFARARRHAAGDEQKPVKLTHLIKAKALVGFSAHQQSERSHRQWALAREEANS